MKLPARILITALASALTLPLVSFAAKADKKNKDNPSANFAAMDKDGDGSVSESEYIAATKDKDGEEAAKAKFGTLDKNHDGKLKKGELTGGGKGGKKKGKKNNEN